MSDKSYQIKENNQVMIQGGEKKVMKKILSVALSTAMAFSMFASVAFGDDALNTQQKFDVLKEKGIFTGYPDGTAGLDKEMTRAEFAKVLVGIMGLEPIEGKASFKDKNYKADKWPAPYVEAVYAAGLMEGKNTTKMIFDFNGKITIQEMAKVLVTAQKLDIPTETNNNASDWAKGYVQAAINAGLVDAKANPKANASRSQLVDVAYSIYLAQQKPAVVSYEVKEDGKVVEFKLANNEVVKVTLETALKANVAQDVKFTHNNYEYTHNVTWVVTAASKIQGVSANNLKQVVVAFDGKVDEATAENGGNYSITGLTFESNAELSEDGKTVTLTIAQESGVLNQQKEYTINVKGVKNADRSRTFNEALKFSPVDTTLPEVQEVVGLGTKAFKVVFSEPVQQSTVVSTSNFQVDGKAVNGYVTYQYPNIAIISTDLAVGNHELTVRNVKDYAGFTILPETQSFTVAEDKTAPEVVKATTYDLSSATIEFNEPVKSVSKVYHTSSGKTGKATIRDNKVFVDFGTNKLSLAETTIYLEGVTDYSNNSANRDVKVTPELDTERPTVVGVTAEVEGNNHEFTIEFSEAVDLGDVENTANYVLKDKDGKAVVGKGFTTKGNPVNKPVIVTNSQNKKVKITSIGQLASGVYTLEISNIRDRAAIGNAMLPYSTTIDLGDVERPQVLATSYYEVTHPGNDANFAGLDIIVHYSKAMAQDGAGSVLEANKYNFNSDATSSVYNPLPVDTQVSAINSETVRISLPAKQGGYVQKDANAVNQAISLRVTNVADTNGNYIAGNVLNANVKEKGQQSIGFKSAKATDKDSVAVEFNGPLSYVYAGDFQVVNTVTNDVYNVSVASHDGAKVTFDITGGKVLAADAKNLKLRVVSSTPQSVNFNGLKVTGEVNVEDGIRPTYVENSVRFIDNGDTTTAVLTFNEAVKVAANTTAFKVYVGGDSVKVTGVTQGAANEVQITFDAADVTTQSVQIYSGDNFETSKFVTDTSVNENAAEPVAIIVNR
ncbi:Ig-like domain-containing protein [Paenibacillus lautus]|uniref:Ig-like domain-containing protein n=1 Tax=Paenibacillus lautus TaxID=1401 RepID=UPI000BBDC3B0|nr:S-layer homology domain-containing protein [Paenibacillus lautus]PCL91519.1 S-layer protein [Paenibacillus lautus]